VLAAGEAWGGGGAEPVERVPGRVRLRQPDRAAARRARAQRRPTATRLARILEFRGHDVCREYYVNDFGTQALKLGESIQARAAGRDVPEDGYPGDYVAERRRRSRSAAAAGRRGGAPRHRADGRAHRASLDAFRVASTRGSPSTAPRRRAVAGAPRLRRARRPGRTYRSEGAPVAAHQRLRRRQGPRARALQRRPHLLRLRHRLPPGEARARLRPADRRPRAPTITATWAACTPPSRRSAARATASSC
jgi:hypothetical protein